MANSRDVKINLAVGTTGAESVTGLASDLRGVSTAGKDAAPGIQKLAAELATLELRTQDLRAAEAAARAEVGLQKAARADLVDTLARLKAETDKAGRSSADYATKERQLRLEIIESRAALRSKQTALESASTAARVAAAAEANLSAQIRETSNAYRAIGAASQTSAAQQNAANKSVTSGLSEIGGQLRTIQQLAGAAIGGTLVGGLAGDVGKTADAYANLAARIKLATGEGAAFDAAFQGVFDVATRTGVAVEQTSNLFTRLAEAGKQIGVSSAEALRLTESINQAVQLSGASAESSNAAIIQLIQGLQSGTLRGEELNSVLEQAPRLAKALAEGLGVATGDLKKLGEAGSLTAQAVIASLQGQSKALQDEFGQLPATIGRSLQNLSTEWTRYVGEADKATGASATAARAINLLAENLDTLGTLLFAAGKAALAYQAVKLAQTFLGIGSAAKIATAELVAMNVAQTASGAASTTAAAGMGRFAGVLSTLKVAAAVGVLANLKEIGTEIGEGIARWAGYTDGVKEAAKAAKDEADATAAQIAAKASYAQKLQLAADKGLGLSDISRKLVGDFEQLKFKGESTADVIEKLAKNLELKDLGGIANAGAALDALAVRGKITADDISAAYQKGLAGVDLVAFATNAEAAFDKSEQGARRLKGALDAVALESLARAGTSVSELQGGFSRLGTIAVNDVDTLAKTLTEMGIKGDQAGRLLTAALDKTLALATTERAVKVVEERIEELGKKGLLTGDQVAAGLSKAREKADSLKDGINSVDEALSKFGLKSRGELTKTADTLAASYAKIVNATGVSLAEKQNAFDQYSKAAIAANGGVETSEVTLQREILRARTAAADMGSTLESSMARASNAVLQTTADLEKQAAVIDAINARYGQSKADREGRYSRPGGDPGNTTDGFKSNKDGSAQGTFGNNLDLSAAFNFVDKAKKNQLKSTDLDEAEFAYKKAQDALFYMQEIGKLNPGGQSAEFVNSTTALYNATRAAYERVKAMKDAERDGAKGSGLPGASTSGAGGPAGVGGPAPARAPTPSATAPAPGPSNTRTLNINIGGRSTAVNVSSQADSNALVNIFRDLEAGRGASQ